MQIDCVRRQRHKVEQPQAAELRTENAELNEKLLGLKEEQVALLKQHDACKVDKADLAKRYVSRLLCGGIARAREEPRKLTQACCTTHRRISNCSCSCSA